MTPIVRLDVIRHIDELRYMTVFIRIYECMCVHSVSVNIPVQTDIILATTVKSLT